MQIYSNRCSFRWLKSGQFCFYSSIVFFSFFSSELSGVQVPSMIIQVHTKNGTNQRFSKSSNSNKKMKCLWGSLTKTEHVYTFHTNAHWISQVGIISGLCATYFTSVKTKDGPEHHDIMEQYRRNTELKKYIIFINSWGDNSEKLCNFGP